MRGQATVELALGSIVFVGVLLIGIHMAEYAQLSLKVQEAQTAAVWEATGRRVQERQLDGTTNASPFGATLDRTSGVPGLTEARYADFDGLSTSNGGNVVGRALTEGSGVSVTCVPSGGLHFEPTRTAAPVLLDVGGLQCSSSAELRAINIPRAFLQRESGGFFDRKIVRDRPSRVCGLGLPVEGQCRGALAILTNDWGLVGEETKECLNPCRVSHYRGMVEKLFAGGGSAGRSFAERYAGSPPIDATNFFFSYAGVESGMRDFVGGEGTPTFITGGSGLGMVPKMTHPKCFLGKNCP
ncbi:MAG: TadE/TadG family type IV pilus assembly protein [Myxococcota bacterium]